MEPPATADTPILPAPPALPPPPPPSSAQPTTFGLRPVAGAGACLLLGGPAGVLAFRTLWPYPPPHAAEVLAGIVAGIALTGLLVALRVHERWAQLSPNGTHVAYSLMQPDGSTDLHLMGGDRTCRRAPP